jgi:tetratricopeptide (TPR) repeat protein
MIGNLAKPARRVTFVPCLFLVAALAGCGGSSGLSPPANPLEKRAQSIYEDGKKALSEGDSETALRKFKEALKISETQNLQEGVATNLHSIALTHIQRQEWRLALRFMERALAVDQRLFQKIKKAPARKKLNKAKVRIAETKVASDLNDLARIHQRLGEPEAALKRLGELLSIDLRLGREQGAAITHNNIGRIFLAMDNLERAKRHYLVAMALLRKVKDEKRMEAVRRNLLLLERIRRSRKNPSTKP